MRKDQPFLTIFKELCSAINEDVVDTEGSKTWCSWLPKNRRKFPPHSRTVVELLKGLQAKAILKQRLAMEFGHWRQLARKHQDCRRGKRAPVVYEVCNLELLLQLRDNPPAINLEMWRLFYMTGQTISPRQPPNFNEALRELRAAAAASPNQAALLTEAIYRLSGQLRSLDGTDEPT